MMIAEVSTGFTTSSRWPPREARGTHKTSDPPRFSGKPALFDRERFKSSVLPPSAVIKDHAEPRRALDFQATARRGEEPLDEHERHDDTLGVRCLASFKMRFLKAARSRTEGGPAWSDKVDEWGHKHGKRGTGGRDEAAARWELKTIATQWSVASWSGISSVRMRK
ncbi:hypothetical protein PsorP6_014281 [Peronosclerospora sorghi]|uniref:Uncharacterized protein n=1 Tax=Peronosclerospora sorghi TaxID=230839 RepID=A0ACC0VI09_9STRA|nr:hypothetical protein PsorP6_014281 [Peronosclerospora sorghi]